MADQITDQIQQRLLAYLKDAHALEQMSLQMTHAAAKAADDRQLRQLLEHHHRETQEHEQMIRGRLEAHGESPSPIRDIGARIAALARSVEAILPSDAPGRLARDAYVQEQTEIAAYELLSRIAERAGDSVTAELSRRILLNERETADRIAATWDRAADLSLQPTGAT